MTKLEILKKCSLTSGLSDEHLSGIADMCDEETFEIGEHLGRQGRLLEKVYIIEDGLVGIYLELGPMSKRQLQAASNFEAVCWEAMISPYRSTSTGIAIETTKVLAFNGEELLNLCFTNPGLGCRLGQGLASVVQSRLNSAYSQLMGVAAQE